MAAPQTEEHEHVRYNSRSTGLEVNILAGHVVDEVVDVGEEVVVGEMVVGVRSIRDEPLSSRTGRSPKTSSPFSYTGLKEVRFRWPTAPICGVRPKLGWGRSLQHLGDWNSVGEEDDLLLSLSL